MHGREKYVQKHTKKTKRFEQVVFVSVHS